MSDTLTSTGIGGVASMNTLPIPTSAMGGIQAGMAEDIAVGREQAAKAQEIAQGTAGAQRQYVGALQQAAVPIKELGPTPEFIPTKETATELSGLFGMLGVLGTMIGGKGKSSGMDAMSAMTGMMQGYQQGRKDLYDREYSNFQAATQRFNAELAKRKTDYELALTSAKGNLDAAIQGVQAEALKHDDQIMLHTARAKGLQGITSLLQDRERLGAQYANSVNLERIRHRDQVAAQAPIQVTLPDGTPAFIKAAVGPDGNVSYQPLEGYRPKPAAGEGINSRSLANAGLPSVPEKEATTIVGAVRSARDTLALVERAKSPEILFGELNKVSTGVESWWKRNVVLGSNDSFINASDAQTQISRNIDAAAKEANLSANDKNVVFYKEAIFTILESERAARGGSLLPVAVMKTLTPLLDPKNLTKEAFVDIMTRRATQLAQSTNLTQDQFDKVYKALPHISLPGTTPQQASGAPSAGNPAAPGNQTPSITPEQLEKARKALAWANENPNDPNADAVRKAANRILGGG